MKIKVSENFEQMLHDALDATNEILQDYELDEAQNRYYRDVRECLQYFSLLIEFGYCGHEICTNAEMIAEMKKSADGEGNSGAYVSDDEQDKEQ